MNFNPDEQPFIMTLLERFNVIHVNFMIMLEKKKEEEEKLNKIDAFNDSAILIIIRVTK